jgi:ribosomal protein L32
MPKAGGEFTAPQNGQPGVMVDISPEARDAYNRYMAGPRDAPEGAQRYAAAGMPPPKNPPAVQGTGEKNGAAEIVEAFKTNECQTCKNRKYQDGSNDPSVSFQSPTHIGPNQAATAVAAHEGEHVAHEQAKAQREDRRIVSQTVTLHTSICPECGRVYISGGVTRTVTANKPDNNPGVPEENA